MALNTITGEHYSNYNGPVLQWTQELVHTYLTPAQFEKFGRILDLGCGTGENSVFIAEFTKAKELLGLDSNKDFIDYAKMQYQNHCQNLSFEVADLSKSAWTKQFKVKNIFQTLLNPNERFDLVFSSFVLHWFPDVHQILVDMTSVMDSQSESFHVIGIKPSETFMHTMKQLLYHPRWINDLENFRKEPKWQSKNLDKAWNSSKDPAQAFKEILIEAGHEVLLCEQVHVSYKTRSREENKGLLRWLLPLCSFIKNDRIEEFIEDAQQIYERMLPTSSIANDGLNIWQNDVLVVRTCLAPKQTIVPSTTMKNLNVSSVTNNEAQITSPLTVDSEDIFLASDCCEKINLQS